MAVAVGVQRRRTWAEWLTLAVGVHVRGFATAVVVAGARLWVAVVWGAAGGDAMAVVDVWMGEVAEAWGRMLGRMVGSGAGGVVDGAFAGLWDGLPAFVAGPLRGVLRGGVGALVGVTVLVVVVVGLAGAVLQALWRTGVGAVAMGGVPALVAGGVCGGGAGGGGGGLGWWERARGLAGAGRGLQRRWAGTGTAGRGEVRSGSRGEGTGSAGRRGGELRRGVERGGGRREDGARAGGAAAEAWQERVDEGAVGGELSNGRGGEHLAMSEGGREARGRGRGRMNGPGRHGQHRSGPPLAERDTMRGSAPGGDAVTGLGRHGGPERAPEERVAERDPPCPVSPACGGTGGPGGGERAGGESGATWRERATWGKEWSRAEIGGCREARVLATRAHIPEGLVDRMGGVLVKGVVRGGAAVASVLVGRMMEVGARTDVRVEAVEAGRLEEARFVGRGRLVRETPTGRVARWLGELKRGRAAGVLQDLRGEEVVRATDEEVAVLFPRAAGPAVVADEALLGVGGKSAVRLWTCGEDAGRWEEMVWKVVEEKGADVCAGVSGMRFAHLAQIRAVAGVREVVAEAVDGLLQGRDEALMGRVRLTFLRKAGGGLRPIGVGETLPQVAKTLLGRALGAVVGATVADAGQWGLVEDAARRLGVQAQEVVETIPGALLVSADIRNAFGTVERAAVVEAAGWALERSGAAGAAGLLETVRACLRPGEVVMGGDRVRVMDRGVVQGDPTSMLLYGAWMARVVARVVERVDGVEALEVEGPTMRERLERGARAVVWAYADDVGVAGVDEEVVWRAYETLREELRAGGQEVNDAKGVAMGEALRVGAAERGVAWAEGMKVLGVPVARGTAVRDRLVRELLAKAAERNRLIAGLPSAFGRLVLHRMAGGFACLQWAWAALGSECRRRNLGALREIQREAVEGLCGMKGGEVDEQVCRRAHLPVHRGGLGLRCVHRWAEAAEGVATEQQRDAREEELVEEQVLECMGGAEARFLGRRQASVEEAGAWRWLTVRSVAAALDVLRPGEVEECALRRYVGAPMVEERWAAEACPMGHGVRVELGGGLARDHMPVCRTAVVNQRHGAAAAALAAVMRVEFGGKRVLEEQGVAGHGGPTARKRGYTAAGTTAPGDVVLRCVGVGAGGTDVFFDLRVKGATSGGPEGGAAAREAYDEKMEEHGRLCRRGLVAGASDGMREDCRRRAAIVFRAVGLDGWGGVDKRSYSELERHLGRAAPAAAAAMARAVVLTQATADRAVRVRMAAAEAQRAAMGRVGASPMAERGERRLRAGRRGAGGPVEVDTEGSEAGSEGSAETGGEGEGAAARPGGDGGGGLVRLAGDGTPGSRWFIPLIHAAAVRCGATARPEVVGRWVERAREHYEAWRGRTAAVGVPGWDELLDIVVAVKRGQQGARWPRGTERYLSAAAQEKVLALREGELPEGLAVVGVWVTETRGEPPSME